MNNKTRNHWLDWEHYEVPEHTRDALENYIIRGYHPGGFLQAVLVNNFVNTVCRADHLNQLHLVDIAKWLVHEAPGECWGSDQAVNNWIDDINQVRSRYVESREKQRMWQTLQQT